MLTADRYCLSPAQAPPPVEVPKPPTVSTHVLRPPTILQASLNSAIAYADRWTATTYPVPSPVPASYTEQQVAALQARHAAVWHEAHLLRQRLERLQRAGARLQGAVVSRAAAAYEEMTAWSDAQSQREEAAVERLVAMVGEAVQEEKPLEFDLRLLCECLTVDHRLRHVAEAMPPPVPRSLPLEPDAFNADQMQGLRRAIADAAAAEAPEASTVEEGGQGLKRPLCLTKAALADTLQRLAVADSEVLPPRWAVEHATPLALAQSLSRVKGEVVEAEEWLGRLATAA